ncbi:NUDIX domain-containing protein [Lentzea sp. PSKA42]|uniref:8-oxo-dGTP diphosphatase n=1 Tax=Lentzea indica TaxID=2604800 RepID=A0ABX1F9A4_9PSEU|nr:NUDIX domain-containing protein [Lentzea indica]NKE55384.1 NUDIX domain-containing protein [Lentzea indica]
MIDSALLERLTEEAAADDVVQLVVGAVVESDEKVLLLKRPADDFMGGIFELPSGKVERGEDLKTALTREVEEETGLQVAAATAYLGSFDYTSGSGKKSRQFNFVVAVDTPGPVVLQEHDEFQWAPIEEELPVTDAVKKVFEAYRELQAN